ncbi:hypothetical protein EHS13_28035 [Paenibacillus psychroresistens]|uniref:Type II toxin-antitoxin system RelE/ParE family toxin n=1 Tax=Paenibacillus psychroresistens TaxID=1778678 RepID=A0A6B8RRH0_9BACL|nr:hypothetical protein [Paenibacillus psychroresistens]QGQ98457.1 hypothetical protein EHS13_28035 [Paenibacillus psychroresistens]
MKDRQFEVIWSSHAQVSLARMKKWKVKSIEVFKRAKYILADKPLERSDGMAEYVGFEFNGYNWMLLNNVIIVYSISLEDQKVYIDACYYANTGLSHLFFWGIEPDDD